MRWTIVRLILHRELRDQLRDRRTLFMIVLLPVFLYPLAGFGLMQLAIGFFTNKNRVAVVGAGDLVEGATPRSAVAWLAAAPSGAAIPLSGLAAGVGAAALASAPGLEYPSLFCRDGETIRFLKDYVDAPAEVDSLQIQCDDSPALAIAPGEAAGAALAKLRLKCAALRNREVDLLIVFDAQFASAVRAGGRPPIYIVTREGDERSQLVNNRVTHVLARWKRQLSQVRLARAGLATDYDDPFELHDAEKAKPANTRAAEGLFDVLVKIFPFVLVMWALAGALYPAVDLCAGEKERGTMETLLISPASREEIVYGKFLAIWLFSAATALLNLLSMGLTTWEFSSRFDAGSFRPGALVWGVVLLLPLSAFFSALCLAVGAYARSSKEGQYYLMPLFLVTMPLVFLTLAPGVELNPFYSMVPVTGVALLLQKLMSAAAPDGQLWLYFVPVLAPMVIYGWLALRWAIEQFQREEVLFREAERLDVRLWLRRLWRDKEALPSTGQSLFCFALILGLHRLTFSVGSRFDLPVQIAVGYLAFIAAPPLFMALLLTVRPREGLACQLPSGWTGAAAVGLAVLLFVPGAELTYLTIQSLGIKDQLREYQDALQPSSIATQLSPAHALLLLAGLALLQAICEELAFRGFILSGLRRRFRPWTAVFLSSFLFALFHMNVFQFVPHFVLGVVMATLVWRSGSVFPAMAFHFVYNFLVYACLAIGPDVYPGVFGALSYADRTMAPHALTRLLLSGGCLAGASLLLGSLFLGRRGIDPAGCRRAVGQPTLPALAASSRLATGSLPPFVDQ